MRKPLSFLKNESGATAIEYGLLALMIAVALVTSVTTLGSNVKTAYNNFADGLK